MTQYTAHEQENSRLRDLGLFGVVRADGVACVWTESEQAAELVAQLLNERATLSRSKGVSAEPEAAVCKLT